MGDQVTEHKFTLPMGYRDGDGNLHRQGVMRQATLSDKILPLKDHRVQADPVDLLADALSCVIVRLGTLPTINAQIIERLSAVDLEYLQDLYHRINPTDGSGAALR